MLPLSALSERLFQSTNGLAYDFLSDGIGPASDVVEIMCPEASNILAGNDLLRFTGIADAHGSQPAGSEVLCAEC